MNKFDLVGTKAIQQGATFNSLIMLLNADYSGWIPRGQIRNHFATLPASEIQVEFDFLPLEYKNYPEVGGLRTAIVPLLSAEKTSLLKWAEKGFYNANKLRNLNAKSFWVYDIKISNGGYVKRLIEGLIEVSLEVTRIT